MRRELDIGRRILSRLFLLAAGFLPVAALATVEMPAGLKAKPPAPATATQPATPQQATPSDAVVYRDGDLLRGKLETLAPEGGTLQWKCARPDAPSAFALDGLHAIFLATQPMPAGVREHRTLVTLTNGDRLSGDLKTLDEKCVKLDTWYAGVLTLKRAMVRSVETGTAAGVLYDGPKDAAEWTAVKADAEAKPWTFENGALVVRKGQHIAVWRQVPGMPDTVRIEVEAQLTPYLEAGIVLCAGEKPDTGLRWQIEPQEGTAILTAWAGKARKCSAQIQTPPGAPAKLVFLLDRRKGTCAVETEAGAASGGMGLSQRAMVVPQRRGGGPPVAGEAEKGMARVAEVTGMTPAALSGDRIVLQSSTRGDSDDPAWFRVKFTEIRVLRWDGRTTGECIMEPAPAEDRVCLASGDIASGRIKGISKGKIVLETPYARMKFPVAEVAKMEFSGKGAEQARLRPGDIRAVFADGSVCLTLSLSELRRGVLKGASENFGSVSLPLAAMARLDFGLYAPAEAAAQAAPADRLVLAGGDRLGGEMVSLDGSTGKLAWRHAAKPGGTIIFDAASVYEAALKPRTGTGSRMHADTVVLDGEAILTGDLFSLDEKSMVLDTWYAGRLTLDRSRVRMAAPGDAGRTLYAGPSAGEEWAVGNYWGASDGSTKWKTADDTLAIASAFSGANGGGGCISRALPELPPAVRFEFDAEWKPEQKSRMNLNVGLFAKGENNGVAGLRLQFGWNGGVLRWASRRANGGISYKNVSIPGIERLVKDSPKLHVTLLADRQARRGAVLFNGETVATVELPGDGAVEGEPCFYFGGYPGSATNLPVVSRIRVSSWNGRMPLSAGRGGGDEDVVSLGDGDAVSGRVTALADGKLKVRAAFGDMTIPLAKVLQVDFHGASAAAKASAGDVRVWMQSGGVLTLGGARVDGDVLRGTLSGAGEVTLRLAAVMRLEFNLETPRKIQVPEKFLYKPAEGKSAAGTSGRTVMVNGRAIQVNGGELIINGPADVDF